MAKIHTLTERDSGATIYPETCAEAVYFNDGSNLRSKIERMQNEPRSNLRADELLTPDNLPAIKTTSREELKQDLFIDMWRAAWGNLGGYDEDATDGHPYLGNGLRMTYGEAMDIMAAQYITTSGNAFYRGCSTIRTNLPPRFNGGSEGNQIFHGCKNLEVAYVPFLYPSDKSFSGCMKLRKITVATVNYRSNARTFESCIALEEIVTGEVVNGDLDLRDSPRVNLKSFQDIVEKAPGAAFAITVHPDIYAKLTDGTCTEWHQTMLDALEKQITFITT